MSKITDSEMKHLAGLSNLLLGGAELKNLKEDLTRILDYVEELNEVDTTGVEPTYQVFDLQTVWRDDDEIDYGVKRKQLLGLAENVKDNSVVVPKVL
ncbi:MAG: Asp-tRNA(Asn)/Glu-tRNA(Gln) amidotransferase subunit GatC [Candidatus Nomurabacteria bacterium]|jgi:aspartyl-tRNA(Asn)/glutamyl-tRNA(Gln) amidotransferase subunit C|nr:Asp-tRNA(Asn)/Glu-tRNA(Gln) amidotransferase subunit GatC [Candidatus Nomurabacteria bacterium]